MIQNIKTKDFFLTGTVESQKQADDGKILSYNILTDKGFSTTWHRRFLRPLVAVNDPEIPESVESNDGDKTTDLPNSDDITSQRSLSHLEHLSDGPRGLKFQRRV